MFGVIVGTAIGAASYTIYQKKRKKPETSSPHAAHPVPSAAPGIFTKKPRCSAGSPSGKSADISQNTILCKGVIPIEDGERINSNILVFGGNGSGKIFNIIAPNLLQMDASYVITDPDGGLLRSYGRCLENMGYRIKCLNLINTEQSNHYNPFAYIRSEEAEEDIRKLAEVLMCNTLSAEPAEDPFRYHAGLTILKALIGYLYNYEKPEARALANIIKLLQAGVPETYEENKDPETPLDILFEKAKETDPDGYAVNLYSAFLGYCSPQMRRDLLASLCRRLAVFGLDKIEELTATDDIELDTVSDRKTALFVVISTGDKASNVLASILYSQVFCCLKDYAEHDAPKTKLVVDGNKEIIKAFRPDNAADDAAVRERAEDFLDRAKKGQISYDDDLELWTLRTTEGELVLWRGSREEIEKAHTLLKAGSVITNQEKNDRASHLPVATRFFLDAFTETGILPDFPTTIVTFGKYGASFFLFLHTLSQMRNMYPLEWDRITGSCNITVCLGGGIDTSSARYVSLLSEKIIRKAKNASSHQKSSASFCKQIRKPLSEAELKALPEKKCLILVSPHNGAYISDKYTVTEHPQWVSCTRLGAYTFDPSRHSTMR